MSNQVKITPAQQEIILREIKAGSSARIISEKAKISSHTAYQWKKRFAEGNELGSFQSADRPKPPPAPKKTSRDLLVSLVKSQLDSNPDFAARCVKLLDLKEMLRE